MRGWAACFLVAICTLGMVGHASAQRQEAVRLQGLSLLREPNDQSTMIRALKAGETVTVLERQGDYVAVALADGTQGYVHGGFLTGFADIAPVAAYADRIDPAVVRPKAEGKGQPAGKAPVASRSVKAAWPGYVPTADGGGLALFLTNLSTVAEVGRQVDAHGTTADFNARKNRYAIEVHLSQRKLYLYKNLPDGSRRLVREYVVAVPGKEMEAPLGWGVVTGISLEPSWRPTPAMKERALKKGKPLPEYVRPGVRENPMGTFKIILSHGYGFRIHGNNNPRSIGRPVTSGCIRMRNDEGRDMARLIDVGTEVVFLE